MNKQMGL